MECPLLATNDIDISKDGGRLFQLEVRRTHKAILAIKFRPWHCNSNSGFIPKSSTHSTDYLPTLSQFHIPNISSNLHVLHLSTPRTAVNAHALLHTTMGHRKRQSHHVGDSDSQPNCNRTPSVLNPILEECLTPEATKIWDDVLNDLKGGRVPPPELVWPRLVFPIAFAVCPDGHPPEECMPISLRDCIKLLRDSEIGYRIGQAVRVFYDLPQELMQDTLSSLAGNSIYDGEWICGWMQVYNRILHMHGVETRALGRDICSDVQRKLEILAPQCRPSINWSTNPEIFECWPFQDPTIGNEKAGMQQLVPEWKPNFFGFEQKSPFMEGMWKALDDNRKLKDEGKKEKTGERMKKVEQETMNDGMKPQEAMLLTKEAKTETRAQQELLDREAREHQEWVAGERRRHNDEISRRLPQTAAQELHVSGLAEGSRASSQAHSRRRRPRVYEDRGPPVAHHNVDRLTGGIRRVRFDNEYGDGPHDHADDNGGPHYGASRDQYRR